MIWIVWMHGQIAQALHLMVRSAKHSESQGKSTSWIQIIVLKVKTLSWSMPSAI
jgi:hypothetical protein